METALIVAADGVAGHRSKCTREGDHDLTLGDLLFRPHASVGLVAGSGLTAESIPILPLPAAPGQVCRRTITAGMIWIGEFGLSLGKASHRRF